MEKGCFLENIIFKFNINDVVEIYRLPIDNPQESIWFRAKNWIDIAVEPFSNKPLFIKKSRRGDIYGVYYELNNGFCYPEGILKLIKEYKKPYWKKIDWKV